MLDQGLEGRQWLAGEYSIADVANWCWVRTYHWSRVSRDGLENLESWLGQMNTRPACQNGIKVPEPPPKTMLEGEEQKSFVKGAQSIVQR